MSYRVQYAGRRPTSVWRPRRGVRLDERTLLNFPDYDGGAYVRVFVEDTSGRKARSWGRVPSPKLRLRIADCVNTVNLEFGVECADVRENSLHKIDTLLGALHRFRDALAAEADLYATRSSRKEDLSCRT